jgi:hypothetical protein
MGHRALTKTSSLKIVVLSLYTMGKIFILLNLAEFRDQILKKPLNHSSYILIPFILKTFSVLNCP